MRFLETEVPALLPRPVVRRRQARTPMPFASINPATGQPLRRYPPHDRRAAGEILAHVHQAQRGWARVAPAVRAGHLRALGRQLQQEREELARLLTTEMGKPLAEARREVDKCAAVCAHYAATGPILLDAECRPGAPAGSAVLHQPVGVVLAIMPWNFPFWQTFRAAAPALLAGNGLLLKPAPNVSGCALALEGVATRAGLPPDLFRVVLAERATVARLIADPRVGFVAFTGSTATGRKIAALAGAALKPGAYELGGSDAYLVLEDADLAHAAGVLAAARLTNAGQTCISPKRLIVHRAVAGEFTARLEAAFAACRSGDPLDPATQLGPLARDDLRRRVHRLVRTTAAAGARIVAGGRVPSGPGFFYPPTILTDVRPDHRAAQEELFGPVAVVIPVADEDEAVAVANATPFGLGAGVFTRDRARGERIATERLEAGMVCVNGCVRSDNHLPFGGTKASGMGRELGPEGLRSVTRLKTLLHGR